MGDRRVLLLGAGGHGKAVIDLLLAGGTLEPWGVVDAAPRVASVLGVAVLGDEAAAAIAFQSGVRLAHPAIGANQARLQAGLRLEALGFALPALVHPRSCLATAVSLGEGCVVMALAAIGAEARLGRLVLINTGAIVEHDAVIGDGAHVGPGAVVAGGVRIGARALIGAGAVIRPGTVIGEDAVVGAGAAVVADVPPGATVAGVPARRG